MKIVDKALDIYDGAVDRTSRFVRRNTYELIGVCGIAALGISGLFWTDSVCRDAHEWGMQKGVYEGLPWSDLSFDEKVKYSTEGLRSPAATENSRRFKEVQQQADDLERISEKSTNGEPLTIYEKFLLERSGM